MCGISIVISENPTLQHFNVLGGLMSNLHHRGTNGTGTFTLDKMNKVSLPPAQYVKTEDWNEMAMDYISKKNNFAVCHNRSGIGGPQKDLHPFTHQHITGVHNGWFYNLFEVMDKEGMVVDSDAAFHLIAKHGKGALAWMKGAYCMAWKDDRDQTLHLMKNDDIDFYIQKVGDTIFGCSEERILKRVLSEHDIEFKPEEGCKIISGAEYIFKDGKLKEIV